MLLTDGNALLLLLWLSSILPGFVAVITVTHITSFSRISLSLTYFFSPCLLPSPARHHCRLNAAGERRSALMVARFTLIWATVPVSVLSNNYSNPRQKLSML